jgi:hypothetical protein
MRTLTLLMATAVTATLVGCQKEEPAAPQPAVPNPGAVKPFLVKNHAGIEHEFYRDVTLDAFLKQQPSGSVDSVNLDFGKGPQVFALVKVPEQPGMDWTKVRFETSFKTADGQVIDKRWTAAKDRKTGNVVALFCLPPSVVDGETKIVKNGD